MEKFLSRFSDDINKMPEDNIIIGDDLAILSFKSGDTLHNLEPTKLDRALIIVSTSGCCNIKINLIEHEVEAPMLISLMPGQIIEMLGASSNFQAYAIALSKRFIDMVNIPGWQNRYLEIYNNPTLKLDGDQLYVLRIFFTILHRAASNTENPFRLQVIENLLRVFYYGGISSSSNTDSQTPYKNSIVRRFMELVQEHHQHERLIGFYADKLCITPKYLSKLVKENTGRSAGEWIENHVILEARAMLQSPNMTIQQIATALNFPNQSFFGKYFKRATGMSPKQYRQSK